MPEHSVASAELFSQTKKGAWGLLFLCSSTFAIEQDRYVDPAQIQFEAGVSALLSDDLENALRIFGDLYKKTNAPRVKLEWARAAFLAKKYGLSSQLFNEVLAENLPDSVRFNISLWLTEISALSDQTDYGFTFVRDTNPFAVGKQQTILIYGTPFLYSPPQDIETLLGLNFHFRHSRTLNASGTVRLIVESDNTVYQGRDNIKTSVKAAIQVKRRSEDNLSLRLGFDHFFQRSELFLKQPYVGIQYRKDQVNGVLNRYQLDATVTKNIYPDYSFADGRSTSLTTSATSTVKEGVQIGGILFLDQTKTRLRSQGAHTFSGTVFARLLVPSSTSTLTLSLTKSRKNYNGIDELFLLRRHDMRDVISASIQPNNLKVFGLFPNLEIGSEKSTSNIKINSFERTFLNFSLKKNY